MTNALAPIAVTMGEPAGIGGEIALRAWRALQTSGLPFFVIDDPARLRRIAEPTGVSAPIISITSPVAATAAFADGMPVLSANCEINCAPGQPDARHGAAVIRSIERAVALVREGAVLPRHRPKDTMPAWPNRTTS